MPHHFISQPVANSLQSGTFKRGGKVKHRADGGAAPEAAQSDIQTARNQRAYEEWKKGNVDKPVDFMGMAKAIPGMVRRVFSPEPAASAASAPGAVTKTKESVTYAPGKKRGGKC